ncbi:hypothetical protein UFOVP610_28 [uncultured Caudovirales phage]|uniref:Uncharacterized protein n=1 Tax=uncultured Caudovirales phage TaxID=2100421 RepID=A0A6J5N625_9CAUD|nr:hypothetical protein UFOVP610_28 [uncultured Caudovirales phage]
MGRIRSIKPEFWRDEKIATLDNKLAGFFFIGLWNVADDTGKFPLSSKALALEMPIFRSKDILTYIRNLSEVGLIQVSECSQWGLVVNWYHQKIDKPRPPKVKNESIQWFPVGHSSKGRDQSSTIRRKDRIGEEKIGSRIGLLHNNEAGENDRRIATISPSIKKLKENQESTIKANAFIAAYYDLFLFRYGVKPEFSGKDFGIAKRLSKTLSEEKAKDLLQAYFNMPDGMVNKAKHPLNLFELKMSEVVVFAGSGQFTTHKQAQMNDEMASNMILLQQVRNGEL